MTNLEYAPESMLFYSVNTPSVFNEFLLPADPMSRSDADRKKIDRLENLAEKHGTGVTASPYRLG